MSSVYLRPLEVADALVSYQWRNNAKIWRFTGNRPDKYITPEIETEWLRKVLSRPNEKRFAICLTGSNQYIGNVFLTDITDKEAQLHIFIGDITYWGRDRAYDAIRQLLDYSFNYMNLQCVYSLTRANNLAVQSVIRKLGCAFVGESDGDLKHIFTREMFEEEVARK